MSKTLERQRFIRHYKEKTGETEIDMHKVADFAIKMGWQLPKPADPRDLLAKLFADAARQQIRRDNTTKKPYRAYHAVPVENAQKGQLSLWIDIDDPNTTFKNFRKSAVRRREMMIDDGVQLSFDCEHWNSLRPEDEHVDLPMDLSLDIDIRKASYEVDDEGEAA